MLFRPLDCHGVRDMLQKKPSRVRKLIRPLDIAALLVSTVIAPAVASRPGPEPTLTDEVTKARTLLETLPGHNHAVDNDYYREKFGPAWSDDVPVAGVRNGCDTRIICTVPGAVA
ncbi:hypothetical protein [Nocardia aurantiaca]|uniref:hypothetical protein n=1 Tax=Nocardia aurantiaca TaxID=2675850 RepID=UPI0018AB3C6D|nr:hypothetical protein [Nocardia aurantiaca]